MKTLFMLGERFPDLWRLLDLATVYNAKPDDDQVGRYEQKVMGLLDGMTGYSMDRPLHDFVQVSPDLQAVLAELKDDYENVAGAQAQIQAAIQKLLLLASRKVSQAG